METVPEETKQESKENVQASSSAAQPTAAAAPPRAATDPPKKSRREDRRKDEDYVKQFMKAINGASSLEEKMQIAIQMYAHMVDDNKKMQFYIKQSEKRHTLLLKEKEGLQQELNKSLLLRSKLENLCRELQKQNKAIKEESLLKIREEEKLRKETQGKFQSTLAEITAMLQQNNEKNAKLRDDNISMTEKFKSVVTQYQLREQQIDKMSKQMALEQQLADAKLMKASLEHQAEKEKLVAEVEALKLSLQQHRARADELHATETGLRSQLAVYTDKYDEFQNALVKSNKVFGGFKEEMEKMSKKIKKLEKESLSWKKRWETSQSALLDMCGERQAGDERAANLARQLHNMQSLCRTLQAERTVLLSTLKDNNIERPPLPAPAPAPPAPAPAPATAPQTQHNAKMDAMAANCAQLRQSLAHLQSQLNVLTNKQTAEEPKPEKKKVKSKKSKKDLPKESESDSNAKESATESASEDKSVPKDLEAVKTEKEKAGDKTDAVEAENATAVTDDKALESLIQAISNASIDATLDNKDGLDTTSAEVASGETCKDSAEQNPTKPEVDNVTNGVKVVLVTDRLGDDAKVVEFIQEDLKTDLVDEVEPAKIVELSDDAIVPETSKEVKDVANTEIKAKSQNDNV